MVFDKKAGPKATLNHIDNLDLFKLFTDETTLFQRKRYHPANLIYGRR
jgi:hypothetical protein